MKNKLKVFLTGIVTAVIICGLTVSALAANGSITLNVEPIQVLVNGEVFTPKDVQGNDVLVFTYNGTTYAPLRALAEAYGLEVGYDSTKNIATVNAPSAQNASLAADTTYFSTQWTVTEVTPTRNGGEKLFSAVYSGPLNLSEFKIWWKSMDPSYIKSCAAKMAADAQSMVHGDNVTMYFSYATYNLGNAYAFGNDYQSSNFQAAEGWIK